MSVLENRTGYETDAVIDAEWDEVLKCLGEPPTRDGAHPVCHWAPDPRNPGRMISVWSQGR